MIRSPFTWLFLSLVILSLFTVLAPPEKILGANARVVYLHGVWVWTALAAFFAAALVGLIGLISRRENFHRWSRALGRTGLVFWITYLPISMWAMQSNWNGLFLAEPRWRLAVIFTVGGLLLQTGIALLGRPFWASAGNLAYGLVLFLSLSLTENVMHPPSPILDSNALRIQIFFLGLFILTLLAAWQVTRAWLLLEVSRSHLTEQSA